MVSVGRSPAKLDPLEAQQKIDNHHHHPQATVISDLTQAQQIEQIELKGLSLEDLRQFIA